MSIYQTSQCHIPDCIILEVILTISISARCTRYCVIVPGCSTRVLSATCYHGKNKWIVLNVFWTAVDVPHVLLSSGLMLGHLIFDFHLQFHQVELHQVHHWQGWAARRKARSQCWSQCECISFLCYITVVISGWISADKWWHQVLNTVGQIFRICTGQRQEFLVIFYKMNLESDIVPQKMTVLMKIFFTICYKFYVCNILRIVLQKLVSSLEKYW